MVRHVCMPFLSFKPTIRKKGKVHILGEILKFIISGTTLLKIKYVK